jgi:hypothetical protein
MWGDGSSLGQGTKEVGVKRTKVFLLGRYLNPGWGTPVGWAAFPAGVGLTEQSLRGLRIFIRPKDICIYVVLYVIVLTAMA